MHRSYHSIIIPKVGNRDRNYGDLVDLMLAAHTRMGKGVPLDVPDFLWQEMYYRVINRKIPTLCPYTMAF